MTGMHNRLIRQAKESFADAFDQRVEIPPRQIGPADRSRKQGIGENLLMHLESLTDKPILIGTWKAASWAISFYEKNGYARVSEDEKNRLLKKYWSIPERQVETSVVLANRMWEKVD